MIQNEIIQSFSQLIQRKIVEKINKNKFFSVLADETTDISQTEQFSLCIRYTNGGDGGTPITLREDFLLFVPVYDVSGKALANVILEKVGYLGLKLEKLRGQGYDGASSMRGEFRGVQSVIRNKYPKALYTHCVAHCLNLCLSDSSKIQAIRNVLGFISEICTFFRSSPKRTKLLEDK